MTVDETPLTRTPSAIDAAANAYTARLLELDPGFATELGLPGHETEYRDFSPSGLAAAADAARQALDALAGLEAVDSVDTVTLHAMRERLGLSLELDATGWPLADLNNIASPAQEIRAIFDLMPTATAADWEHISGRLANVPAAVSGYISSLRAGAARGLVAARRQVSTVIGQCERHAAADGFFAALAAGAEVASPASAAGTSASASTSADDAGTPLPADLATALAGNAELARAAYGTLETYLRDELLPAAPA